MIWIRNPKSKTEKTGLTSDQKLLIQLILMGGIKDPAVLAEHLGQRKNNLMSRVVTPLLELELLEWGGKESLKDPQRFEETLHEVYVRSGGEETFEKARVEFQKERVRFKKESEENQEELARIAEQIREIGRKTQLSFMEIDFDRLYELEKRRGYLLAGGRR